MPRTRKAVTISLDEESAERLRVLATHHGDASKAVRAVLAGAPQPEAPRPVEFAGPVLPISEAGHAVLRRLADAHDLTVEEVGRRALRYAVQYPARWINPT